MPTAMPLSADGQFTISKALLDHLGVKAGETVLVKKMPDGSLKLEAEKKRADVLELAGVLASETDVRLSDEALDEAIRQSYVQRGARGIK
ncbi:MAG: AbrB/MazE/SpoVT family DNA-binding domain-containing protein [Propionivibrio sp.]|nr:AbrB/MazE/SpoVT family DNA-binding domain-containing protein [Propionivibrio sp.]